MNAGILQLGNSLLSYEKQLAVLANNISNADTDRYKNDTMVVKSFEDYFVEQVNSQIKDQHLLHEVYTSFNQGIIEKSKNENEVAIDGEGLIAVTLNNEEVYSRGGEITANENGYLADSNGNLIVGKNGTIQVTDDNFSINVDGSVISDGNNVGTIKVVKFNDNNGLVKIGKDYYSNSEMQITVSSDAKLKQGYVEKSNSNITNEYLRMMEISRMYETNQKTIQIIDEINGKAASEIGRLY